MAGIFAGEEENWVGADLWVTNPAGMTRLRDFELAGFSSDDASKLAAQSLKQGLSSVKQQLDELDRAAQTQQAASLDSDEPQVTPKLSSRLASAITRTVFGNS